MKILYLSAWFPYPQDNGARIRAYQLMKGLAAEHEVHLISLLQPDSDPADAHNLQGICSVVSLHDSRWFKPGTFKSLLGFFSSAPRSVIDTYDRAVSDVVRRTIASIRPDVIVASSLGIAAYVPRDVGIPTILDEHNCEFGILKRTAQSVPGRLRRLRYELGWKKAARWEARICRNYDVVSIVSEQDRNQLLEATPGLESTHVVPNGVDTEHYTPDNRRPQPGRLLYNGALTYGANLDAVRFFASEVYPLLDPLAPGARLSVTGRTSGVDLDGIADCPGVELTGYVDDIRTVLAQSALCVVTLRQGGGSRLKILEAMAAGVPVVSTSMGAEGLDVKNGTHLIIADSPSELAEAIARALSDQALSNALATEARSLVERQYSWSVIAPSFRRIVESVALPAT